MTRYKITVKTLYSQDNGSSPLVNLIFLIKWGVPLCPSYYFQFCYIKRITSKSGVLGLVTLSIVALLPVVIGRCMCEGERVRERMIIKLIMNYYVSEGIV